MVDPLLNKKSSAYEGLESLYQETLVRESDLSTSERPASNIYAGLEDIYQKTVERESENNSDTGRTIGGTVKDIGITALKGAISVPEVGVGLLDIPTGGRVGKFAEEKLGYDPQKAKEILSSFYSDPQKEAFKKVSEAGGFLETIKAAVKHPSTIAHTALESAPLMGTGGVFGKGVQAIAKISPWVAAAIGEGLVGAGLTAEQIRQETETGRLTPKQSAIAIASGLGTGAFNLAGGRLANKFGFDDIDTLIVSGKSAVTREAAEGFVGKAKDVGKRILAGGLSEGVFEELPQSIQEQVWSNAALGLPLGDGVPNAAAMGLLTGATMGAGVNVLAGGITPPKVNELQDTERRITNLEAMKNRSEKQEQILSDLKASQTDLKAKPEFQESEKLKTEERIFDLDIKIANLEDIKNIDANPKAKENLDKFKAERATLGPEGIVPTDEEKKFEKDITAQREKKDRPLTREELNQQYIDNIDKVEQEALAGRVSPETIKDLQEKRKQLESFTEEEDFFEKQAKEIKEKKPTPQEISQARIKAGLSDIELQEREDRQAQAIPSKRKLEDAEFKQKIDTMQTEVVNTKTGGVTQEIPTQQKEGAIRFSADSPQWMQQIQSDRKADKKPALSRKELNVLFDKTRSGKPLTEKQADQYSYLERAINEYAGEIGEFAAQEDLKGIEQKGFEAMGGQNIPVADLNKGDKFIGEVDGIQDEWEVKGENNQGEIILQDGVQKTVDLFDEVKVDGLKATDKEALTVEKQIKAGEFVPAETLRKFPELVPAEQILDQKPAGMREFVPEVKKLIKSKNISSGIQNISTENLEVTMSHLTTADKNLKEGKVSITPKDPIDVEFDIDTDKMELIDGYHRYLMARGGSLKSALEGAKKGDFPNIKANITLVKSEISDGFKKKRNLTEEEIKIYEEKIKQPTPKEPVKKPEIKPEKDILFATTDDRKKQLKIKTTGDEDIINKIIYDKDVAKYEELDELADDFLLVNDLYVHGRSGGMSLSKDGLVLVTTEMDIAKQYGRDGSIHFFEITDKTKSLNLSSENTKDMDMIVEKALLEKYIFGDYVFVYDEETGQEIDFGKLSEDVVEEKIEALTRKAFSPTDIIDSAEGFDNPDFFQWFYETFGEQYDFVETPDGGVILNPENIKSAALEYHQGEEIFLDPTKADIKLQTDQTPGQGVTLKDIQKQFKGQNVFISPDGSISIRYKNGKGVRIVSVKEIKGGDRQYGIESGQMSHKGIILGKAEGDTITLTKDYADKKTLSHELYHTLITSGIITKADRLSLNKKHNSLKKKDGLTFPPSKVKDLKIAREENEANTFTQLLEDREQYRGTIFGNIIQKVVDFFDGIFYIGRMSARKLVREVETGKVFERKAGEGLKTRVPAYEKAAAQWYSALTKAVDSVQQKAMPAQQWIQILGSSKFKQLGVKAEEVDWSGVKGWLEGQKKATKQEVLDYLEQNQVVIEDVVKGGKQLNFDEQRDAFEESFNEYNWTDFVWEFYQDEFYEDTKTTEPDQGYTEFQGVYQGQSLNDVVSESLYDEIVPDAWGHMQDDFIDGVNDAEDTTKFSQYQLPGGENYKESFVTLPESLPNIDSEISKLSERQKVISKILEAKETGEIPVRQPGEPDITRAEAFIEQNENREKIVELRRQKTESNWKDGHPQYDDVKNPIVRIRTNERIIDGKKVLVIEEIQGPQKGQEEKMPPWAKKNKYLIGIKKMVRHAAENGFDIVAWTEGKIQVERYDLSKQVDSISAAKRDDGLYGIQVTKDGNMIDDRKVAAEDLADFIGKDLADKIILNKEVDAGIVTNFSGLDLKVGGKGLAAIYDKILPSEVKKFFGKKAWGKPDIGKIEVEDSRVGKKEYSGPEASVEELNASIKKDEWTAQIGRQAVDVRNAMEIEGASFKEAVEEFGSITLATLFGGKMVAPSKSVSLHSLEITPEMKSKALREGLPLFQTKEPTKPDIRLQTTEDIVDLGESRKPVTDEDIEYVVNESKNLKANTLTTMKRVGKDIKRGLDKYLGAISTRLGNINPKLKAKLRKLSFDTDTKGSADVLKVQPLLRKAKKNMTRQDYAIWDYARKNSDVERINGLVEKYDLQKEYQAYRDMLDTLRKEGIDVGLEIGEIEEYAPRLLKDPRGFLEAIGKGDDWDVISRRLREREQEIGVPLSDDQRADLITSMLYGGNYGLGGVPATKARKLKKIPKELNKFYMDSDAALIAHIHSMRKSIEARKFFGKVPDIIANAKRRLNIATKKVDELRKEKNPDQKKIQNYLDNIYEYNQTINRYLYQRDYKDNIGTYVDELLIAGEIPGGKQQELIDILTARFNEKGTRGVIQAYKNLSYIDTMGSVTSAITQIGDLAWAMYEGGVIPALKNAYKSAIGKSRITKEDVGVERVAQEFSDAGALGNAVSKVFKAVGLEKMDSIGKESLLNTALERYQKEAKKDPGKLKNEIRNIFEGETDGVIQDLLNDDITENVKLLVYSRLLDFQPAALSEMPQKYLEAGNGRLFYMLKSFTLKQFDVYRNEIYQKIASPDKKTKIEGFKNLVRLTAFFVIANAGADELKDLVLGRSTDFDDRLVDNMLRLFGVSKFVTWKARTEGLGSAAARQILPPFKFLDAATKDIVKAGDDKGLETLASIPVVGKLAYWHMGRGLHKRGDLWDRRFSKEKKKLNKIKDGLDESKDKKKYVSKHRKEILILRRVNKIQGKLNKFRKRINQIKGLKDTKKNRTVIINLEKQRVLLITNYFKK